MRYLCLICLSFCLLLICITAIIAHQFNKKRQNTLYFPGLPECGCYICDKCNFKNEEDYIANPYGSMIQH